MIDLPSKDILKKDLNTFKLCDASKRCDIYEYLKKHKLLKDGENVLRSYKEGNDFMYITTHKDKDSISFYFRQSDGDDFLENLKYSKINGYHRGFYCSALEFEDAIFLELREFFYKHWRKRSVEVSFNGFSKGGAIATILWERVWRRIDAFMRYKENIIKSWNLVTYGAPRSGGLRSSRNIKKLLKDETFDFRRYAIKRDPVPHVPFIFSFFGGIYRHAVKAIELPTMRGFDHHQYKKAFNKVINS